jgi:hypothetical protein
MQTSGSARNLSEDPKTHAAGLHPAWRAFIRFCKEIGHGDIEKLTIQDGLPVLAEIVKKKTKFI